MKKLEETKESGRIYKSKLCLQSLRSKSVSESKPETESTHNELVKGCQGPDRTRKLRCHLINIILFY